MKLYSNENELIKACLKGEKLAFQELFNRYAPALLSVSRRYAPSDMDAEEIVQESFIKIFDNLKSFRFESSLKTWMTQILIRTALNYLRKSKMLKTELELDLEEHDLPSTLMPDQNLHVEDLLSAIYALPSGYRIVFSMYALDGYSHAEIAQSIGISESTSRSQYSRARALLAKAINQSKPEFLNHGRP